MGKFKNKKKQISRAHIRVQKVVTRYWKATLKTRDLEEQLGIPIYKRL